MRPRFGISLLTTLLVLTATIPMAGAAAEEVVVDHNEVQSVLHQFFDAKNQALVHGDLVKMRQALAGVTNTELVGQAVDVIDRERVAAERGEYKIDSASTAVEVLDIEQQDNGKILATVYEHATYYLSSDGGPDKGGQRILHRVVLLPLKSSWMVMEDHIAEKEGPQPALPGATPKLSDYNGRRINGVD